MAADAGSCHLMLGSMMQAATVTTQSSERGQELAKRLQAAGAKMYGAFWCSHCHEQKETFGQQAMKDFPYVECYPNGFHKVWLGKVTSDMQAALLRFSVPSTFCGLRSHDNSLVPVTVRYLAEL